MGVKKFATEVVNEGKRVRWPKRDVLIPSIITVVIVAAFFAIVLYVEDLAGNQLIEILKEAFAGLTEVAEETSEDVAANI